jgi:hypothetical protein
MILKKDPSIKQVCRGGVYHTNATGPPEKDAGKRKRTRLNQNSVFIKTNGNSEREKR